MKTLTYILTILCVVALTGCGGPSKKKEYVALTPKATDIGPGETVRKQTTKIEEAQVKVFQLGTLITGLTNENAPQVRQQALQLLGGVGYDGGKTFSGGVYQDFSDIAKNQQAVDKAVVQIVEHVRVVEKENTELKLDDPARRRLDWAGFGTLVLGMVLIVGSFFLTTYLPLWVLRIRMAGAVCLIFSGAFYAAAWYLSEIRFVFICLLGAAGLAGLIVAIVYAIRNGGLLKQNIQKIQLGLMTGQVTMHPDASDPQKSVLKAGESPVLAKIVDNVQAAMVPPKT